MPATRTARKSPASLRTQPTSRWERMTSHDSTHIAACSPAWTQTASMRCACIHSSRNHGAANDSVGKSKHWLSAPWKSDHAAGRDRMRENEPDPFSHPTTAYAPYGLSTSGLVLPCTLNEHINGGSAFSNSRLMSPRTSSASGGTCLN